MKFRKTALPLMLCAALLTGCGAESSSEAEAPAGQSSAAESTQDSAADSAQDSSLAAAEDSGTDSKQAEESSGSARSALLFSSADGTEIPISAPASQFTELFDTANSSFSAPSCAFEGTSYTYEFDDFSVETYPDPETKEDRIYAVYLNDSGKTPEGLAKGMTADRAKELYGTPDSENASFLLYRGEQSGAAVELQIFLENQSITDISYILSSS